MHKSKSKKKKSVLFQILTSIEKNAFIKSKMLTILFLFFILKKNCPRDGCQMVGIDYIQNCSLPNNKTI
jgi:hypothetical protein